MRQDSEVFTATREAEGALLGAILVEASRGNRQAIHEVKFIVEPTDFLDAPFYDDQHTRIYRAMLSCADPPNEVVVAKQMDNEGTLRKGDCSYLCMLIATCPCSLDYEYYAKAVADYSLKRKLHYNTNKGNFKKARALLNNRNKPKYTGGITV